jgi:hypothetical protein
LCFFLAILFFVTGSVWLAVSAPLSDPRLSALICG